MNFFAEHLTKLLGSLSTAVGTVQVLITTGAFDGLLSDAGVRWLGIFAAIATALLGGATLARGVNNTSRERVATAMQDAINATPPEIKPNA